MRNLRSTILAVVCADVLGISLLAGQQRGLVEPSIPTIRTDVDMVLVNVTVTDSRNRFVQGLTKNHFRVFEDRVEQDILSISIDDAPISLGIIFDRSGSMGETQKNSGPRIVDTRLSAYSCLKDGLRDDEYFLVEFSNTAQVTRDLTNDPTRIKEGIVFAAAGGRTALWDAIYMGVAKMEQGSHNRKALLVLSDGLENNSRYTLGQVKKALLEQDVRIYSTRSNALIDPLNGLSEMTGGAILRSNFTCEELRTDLRTQYVIAYRSTNRNKDGQFRKISVRLNPAGFPKAFPSLTVRAKEGYYGPQ